MSQFPFDCRLRILGYSKFLLNFIQDWFGLVLYWFIGEVSSVQLGNINSSPPFSISPSALSCIFGFTILIVFLLVGLKSGLVCPYLSGSGEIPKLSGFSVVCERYRLRTVPPPCYNRARSTVSYGNMRYIITSYYMRLQVVEMLFGAIRCFV